MGVVARWMSHDFAHRAGININELLDPHYWDHYWPDEDEHVRRSGDNLAAYFRGHTVIQDAQVWRDANASRFRPEYSETFFMLFF